jgi:hypothetical protein
LRFWGSRRRHNEAAAATCADPVILGGVGDICDS